MVPRLTTKGLCIAAQGNGGASDCCVCAWAYICINMHKRTYCLYIYYIYICIAVFIVSLFVVTASLAVVP